MSKNNIETAKNFIQQWEALKNSFFWNPPANAAGRRSYENKKSWEDFEVEIAGKKITGGIKVKCSRVEIYTSPNGLKLMVKPKIF